MKDKDQQLLWEIYESPEEYKKNVSDEQSPVLEEERSSALSTLEGVHCTCTICEYYVEGDRCGAPGISLSKIPNDDYGSVVICETFTVGNN